jgi:hypothetical protein
MHEKAFGYVVTKWTLSNFSRDAKALLLLLIDRQVGRREPTQAIELAR